MSEVNTISYRLSCFMHTLLTATQKKFEHILCVSKWVENVASISLHRFFSHWTIKYLWYSELHLKVDREPIRASMNRMNRFWNLNSDSDWDFYWFNTFDGIAQAKRVRELARPHFLLKSRCSEATATNCRWHKSRGKTAREWESRWKNRHFVRYWNVPIFHICSVQWTWFQCYHWKYQRDRIIPLSVVSNL